MNFQQFIFSQFQPSSQLAPFAPNVFNVLDPGMAGGADPTGVLDSWKAIQTAIDTAQQFSISTGNEAVVIIPPGSYRKTKPLFVGGNPLRILGAGLRSSIVGPTFEYFGPGIVISKDSALSGGFAPPYTSALVGSGRAWNSGLNTHFMPLDWGGNTKQLNGVSSFCCECFVNLNATQVPTFNVIVSSYGNLAYVVNNAFSLQVGGTGSGNINGLFGNLTVNGTTFQVGSGATTLTPGTTYHVALTYDGATIRLFIAGNLVGSLSIAGTITQNQYESVTLGPSFAGYPAGVLGTFISGLNGIVDSLRISAVPRYTASFTPPTAKLVADSNTYLLLNFDPVNLGNYQQGYWSIGTGAAPGFASSPQYFFPMAIFGINSFSHNEISDLQIDGIYLQGATNTVGKNLYLQSKGWGLWNTNNGFDSSFENINTITTAAGASGGVINSFGPNSYRNHYHTGTGVALGGWGMKADTCFYNSSASLMLVPGGIDAVDSRAFQLSNVVVTDEGTNNPFSSAYIINARGTADNCTFEKSFSTTPPIQFGGTKNDVIFNHCTFNAKTGTSAVMVQGGASAPYNIIVNSPYRWPNGGDPTVPLAIDANINIINNTV